MLAEELKPTESILVQKARGLGSESPSLELSFLGEDISLKQKAQNSKF
jgi:hypothetical protein